MTLNCLESLYVFTISDFTLFLFGTHVLSILKILNSCLSNSQTKYNLGIHLWSETNRLLSDPVLGQCCFRNLIHLGIQASGFLIGNCILCCTWGLLCGATGPTQPCCNNIFSLLCHHLQRLHCNSLSLAVTQVVLINCSAIFASTWLCNCLGVGPCHGCCIFV